MRRIAIVGAAASIAVVSISAAVHAVAIPGGPNRGLPDNDHARGMVFDGLRPSGSDGSCAGGFEIDTNDRRLCTHGPDVAPDGVDVREPRSVAELRTATLALPSVANPNAAGRVPFGGAAGAVATADGSATASEVGIVPVIGDGVSGNRVQAVYAVAADQVDRSDDVAPLIANWAAHVDAMMNQSAALTGGERHVQFVTNADGSLAIEKVILPAEGDDTFGNTIQAMKAAGYNDPARKYLMWTDASIYCGIGNIYGDDKPTPDNYNNGRFAMYSRVDTGCWGKSNSVELHEIVHNMGGVQQSAGHASANWHCTDDYDRMCYRDSSTVTMTYECEAFMEAYLDCGHDDYFHTSPAPGSFLDTHWNVANSSFLHDGPVGGDPPPPPPPPTNTGPGVTIAGPSSTILGETFNLDGTVTDDGLPGPYTVSWSAIGPGSASFSDAGAEDTLATFSTAGTYQITLTADDGDLIGSASQTVTVDEPIVNTAPTVSASGPSSIVLGDGAVLDGAVSDDALPGPYTTSWTATGPGSASFADASAEDTAVSFSAAGTYELTLTANDGELTGSASVTIDVDEPPPPPPPPTNTAPVVSASGPASIVLGDGAALDGTVSDDGLPGPYSVGWSQASGPGASSFADASAEDTSVSFTAAGVYEFVLTAHDGELTGSASVTITVTEPPSPDPTLVTQMFEGSINRKWPVRTFETTVADGPAAATLTFGKSGGGRGGGKKAQASQMTLIVIDESGVVVASATGPSAVQLAVELPAGAYTWEVSGSRTSFALEVTHLQ